MRALRITGGDASFTGGLYDLVGEGQCSCGGGELNDAFFRLPYLYARAMVKRARQNSMFAVAGLSVAFTWGYLAWSVPHIVGYMSSH